MDLFSNITEIFNVAAPPMFQVRQGKMFEQSPTAIPSHKNREDIFNLIYSKGGNSPATIQFHEDGGHGWLQVPHFLLKRLQIESKISGYSFRDASNAFLEEDGDLSLFMNSLGIEGGSELNKLFWSMCPKNYKENSPVRRKARYK